MANFVPCSVDFQNAVKDPESARYWRVLIDINDDDVLEDVTDYLDNNNISGTGRMEGAFGEAVSNQYKVVLRNSTQVFAEGDFAFAKCQIQAKVGTAEYITIFTGFVGEEGCTRKIGALSLDTVSITMFDKTKLLGMNRKTDRVVLANFKISDPASPSTSIFHTLCDMLGLAVGDLDVAAGIDYTKPYLNLEDQNKVWSELQMLAQQYLGILTFRYDGKLRFQSRHETGWVEPSAEWTFSEDEHNIHNPLQMNGGKIFSNRVKTEFDVHEILDQRMIHRNVEGYNVVTGKIAITVLAGEYWPGGSSDSDVAELKYVEPDTGEEYPIGINIQTPTIGASDGGFDIECSGGVLTLESFNGIAGTNPSKTEQTPGSSQIILKNSTGGPITITKLVLYGQPIRVTQKVEVKDSDATVTEEYNFRDKTIDGRYAVSPAQATITTQWWVEYGKVKRKYIQLITDWLPQVQEGALVNLVIPSYGLNMTAQIVSWTHPAAKGSLRKQVTQLVLREWISFSPAAAPETVLVHNQGYATSEGVDDTAQLISSRPTYFEIQEGYDQGGGTTTPSTPSIILCVPIGTKAIMVVISVQLNLTNFYGYEIQVCADSGGSPDGNWYALRLDGVDWKGSPDPAVTAIDKELINHVGIPHTGTIEAPEGRKLHYRVRTVTKAGLRSSWSSTASATTNTVANGDVAENTIYANSLVAGVLNALVAQINSFLEVGGDGFVGKTYGASNGYQECGLSGKDKTIETGLAASTQYFFKVTVDGGSQVEYDITTGASTIFDSVLTLLNNAVVGCTFEVVQGDLRCISKETGVTSSIALAAGTSGTDLFASLDDFTSFDTAVPGSSVALQWGSTRIRVYGDSMEIEFWNGAAWEVFLRAGGQYNGELYPYFQGRGLTQLGAESQVDLLNFGELIPSTGSPRLFPFDNSYEDHDGIDPFDTKSNIGFSAVGRKFGGYCLRGTADTGMLKETGNFNSNMSSAGYSYVYDFWFKVAKYGEARSPILGLYERGGTSGTLMGTSQEIAALSNESLIAADRLAADKVVLFYIDAVTGSYGNLYGVIGTHHPTDNSISWGSGNLLDDYVYTTGVVDVKVLSSTSIVVAYSAMVGGTGNPRLHVVIGTVSGGSISFGTPVVLTDGTANNTYGKLCRLSSTRFVLAWYDQTSTNEGVCVVGNVSGTVITAGSEYVISATANTLPSYLEGLTADKFCVIYQSDSTNDYAAAKTGTITNEDEVSFSPESIISGTHAYLWAESQLCRVDSERLVFAYVDQASLYIYVTVLTSFGAGAISSTTPVSTGNYTAGAPYFGFDIGGMEDGENVRGLIVADLVPTAYKTLPVVINLSTGAVTAETYGADFDSGFTVDTSGAVVLHKNRFHYVVLWARTATSRSVRSRPLMTSRHYFIGIEKVKEWNFSTDEIYFLFQYADSGYLSLRTDLSGIDVGTWYHCSFNYDLSGDYFYLTVNDQVAWSRDTSGDTLQNYDLDFVANLLIDDRLDDLLAIPRALPLTSSDCINHYKKNIRWSSELDYSKDLVIVPGENGIVHFPNGTSGKVFAVYAP